MQFIVCTNLQTFTYIRITWHYYTMTNVFPSSQFSIFIFCFASIKTTDQDANRCRSQKENKNTHAELLTVFP